MYKARHIKFKEVVSLDKWKIKCYTISKHKQFRSAKIYDQSISNLSNWLQEMNSFDSSHDYMAFLILHEGTEGVFSLINTWVGSNMLQTHIFISSYEDPSDTRKISGDGLFACIWELEIINYERLSWIENILKKPEPDYESYLDDTFSKSF